MKVQNFLRRECIAVGATAVDKADVLDQIARLAKQCAALGAVEQEAIRQALHDREVLCSTGFGNGIAIPHCRLAGVEEFVVGVLVLAQGLDFAAVDGQPVRLFVFIVAPPENSRRHVQVLSAISQALRPAGAVDAILAAASPEAVEQCLERHGTAEVPADGRQGKSLFHVFVEDEEAFKRVLELLSAMNWPVLVAEAEPAGTYLAHVPMYAGLWSDRQEAFGRIIVAIVDRGLTNETLRRIENVTGPLEASSKLLVAVHDLFYVAGNLEP